MPMFKEFKELGAPRLPKAPKSPFERLAETIDNGVRKAEEKIKQTAGAVIKEGKKAIDMVEMGAIAGGEALLNISQNKDAEKVVKNFVETITTSNPDQALKKVLDHQKDKQALHVHTCPLEAPVHKELTSKTMIAASPLMMLREVIVIVDGRDEDRPGSDRASTFARFAAHSYRNLKDSVLPEGCKVIDTVSTYEHLQATVYDYNGEIVCAFAGSTNIKDWENNFTQLVGQSVQYEEALLFGKYLVNRYPDKRIIFAGHSQGGGEAAYCAYNLGMQAETYNPAGLSVFTKLKSEQKKGAHINAYIYSSDMLTAIQTAVGLEVDGETHYAKTDPLMHGIHGIKGILRYYKIWYEKIKRRKSRKKS